MSWPEVFRLTTMWSCYRWSEVHSSFISRAVCSPAITSSPINQERECGGATACTSKIMVFPNSRLLKASEGRTYDKNKDGIPWRRRWASIAGFDTFAHRSEDGAAWGNAHQASELKLCPIFPHWVLETTRGARLVESMHISIVEHEIRKVWLTNGENTHMNSHGTKLCGLQVLSRIQVTDQTWT